MRISLRLNPSWVVYDKKYGGYGNSFFDALISYLKHRQRRGQWQIFKEPFQPTFDFKGLNQLARNHLSIIPRGKLIHLLK